MVACQLIVTMRDVNNSYRKKAAHGGLKAGDEQEDHFQGEGLFVIAFNSNLRFFYCVKERDPSPSAQNDRDWELLGRKAQPNLLPKILGRGINVSLLYQFLDCPYV